MKNGFRRVIGTFYKPIESFNEIRSQSIGRMAVGIVLLITGVMMALWAFFLGMAMTESAIPTDSDLFPFAVAVVLVILMITGIMYVVFSWVICSATSHLMLRVQGCDGDFDSFFTGNGYALIVLVVQPIMGILLLMILGPNDILFLYDILSTFVVRIWFSILVAYSMRINYNGSWKQIAISIIIAFIVTTLYPLLPQYISFVPSG